jgi:regulator of ribonuclease activity A
VSDADSSTADFSTADLSDAAPQARALLLPWRDYGGRARFCGPAVTVKCFEDNSLVKELLNQPGGGRVLVVDGGQSPRRALLGDQIAAAAAANGWSGAVIAGVVRDVEVLRGIDLGIKALGASPLRTEKRGEGQRDVPVEIGGALVHSGDWVYADGSGVLVSAGPLP